MACNEAICSSISCPFSSLRLPTIKVVSKIILSGLVLISALFLSGGPCDCEGCVGVCDTVGD